MKQKRVLTIGFVMVCTALFASSALGQTTQPADSSVAQTKPAGEPLNKKRLLKLLTLNDSTQPELIQIVGQKGVDFQPAPADERELHDAGASDDLIVAVRANYRGGDTQNKVAGPDGQNSSSAQNSSQVTQPTSAPAAANSQAARSQPQPNIANGTGQSPKKKSGFAKFNEKLNKVSSALAQQAATAQTVTAPSTQQRLSKFD
jgi:hypothetical protein